MPSTGIMLNSVQYGVILINFSEVVVILSVALCTILLDTERHCMLWCGMLTGKCVFGLGRARVRIVRFVDRVGLGWGRGGILLL